MRALPPLVPSPFPLSFHTLPPISEGMEPSLDSCLPELLAQDLELSRSVFAAKNMTAGAPGVCLSFGEQIGTMTFGQMASPSLLPPPIPPRNRSLRTIQERSSLASFVDKRGHRNRDVEYDAVSTPDSERFGAMEVPSGSLRQHSVDTVPTSVASTQPRISPRDSLHLTVCRGCSWIDADSDYDAVADITPDRFACLSPRPPTPPELSTSAKGISSRGMRRHSHTASQQLPLPAACTSSRTPERRLSIRSEDMAPKRGSLRNDDQEISSTTFNLAPFSHVQRQRQIDQPEPISPLTPAGPVSEIRQPATIEVHKLPKMDSRFDDEMCSSQIHSKHRPQTLYIQPSPPPSPLPSVQSWLCSTSQPYASQLANDELAKAVPLPPDVIETLRVSIACFPETMLLTGSLTIETIRSYARKVRHPATDMMVRSPSAEPLPHISRKSIWNKVRSYRRGSPSGDRRRRNSGHFEKGGFQCSSSSSLEVIKPWASLQHIFGNTSDYICDALYAHIIAYNYISTLIPRCTLSKSRRSSLSPGEVQHEDIPKKAATLLGLSSVGDPSCTAAQGLSKSLSGSLIRDTSTSQVTLSSSYENAVRDIQTGLMRCIVRLVATARLVAESGTGEERLVEMGGSEVDAMLTRSLCEIVRLTEETSPGT